MRLWACLVAFFLNDPQRSRLNTKKVLMLMVRRGLYRWNPLKADLKERDEKGALRDFASEIELVVGAWEVRDEDALPGHVSDEDPGSWVGV